MSSVVTRTRTFSSQSVCMRCSSLYCSWRIILKRTHSYKMCKKVLLIQQSWKYTRTTGTVGNAYVMLWIIIIDLRSCCKAVMHNSVPLLAVCKRVDCVFCLARINFPLQYSRKAMIFREYILKVLELKSNNNSYLYYSQGLLNGRNEW